MAESKPSPFRYPTSLSRLFAHIHLFFHIKASLEGTGSFSHTGTKIPDQEGQLIPEFEQYSPSDPAALCDLLHELARHLRSRLPGCKWFEEGEIEFDSDCPADAGEIANIFAGTMGDRKVLVKCYRFYPSTDYLPSYMRFYAEALACSRYKNQSFVPFIGIYSTPRYPMCLVFEYMYHSNIRRYLQENKHAGRLKLLLEVARGLEYLHSMDVVHKNVKSTNILVDAHGHAHLGGLGVALLRSDTPGVDIDRFFHGAAPELVDHEGFGSTDTGATKASDVYAFGVLAWETLAGQVPFAGESKVAAVVSMWKGNRPARPNHAEVSNRLWRTIQRCWRVDPGQRMAIAEVVAVLEDATARQSR